MSRGRLRQHTPFPIGTKINKLTVLSYSAGKYECVCECGRITRTRYVWGTLANKSCSSKCAKADRAPFVKPPEYGVWCGMIQRCTNPKRKCYPVYGGRGITVCERWNSFNGFLADMGPRPSLAHTLDRIDSNGNYEPSNCRWATIDVQATNRADNRRVCINGTSKIIAEWARYFGISAETVYDRLHHGVPEAELFSLESRRYPGRLISRAGSEGTV